MVLEVMEFISITNKAKKVFSRLHGGCLAFVGTKDFTYGIGRQFQILLNNETVNISVFRSDTKAREWIVKMKDSKIKNNC